jgi:GMP synthase-like glutamine amidotransferase
MPSIAIVDLHGGHPNTALSSIDNIVLANQGTVEIFDCLAGRLPRPRKYDGYILSGGSADPTESAPWRVRLQAAIPEWSKSRPLFGIGLGFQVMAAAYGWPVRVMKEPRDGIFPVTPTPAGWEDPIMVDLAHATPVIERRRWAVLPPPAATGSKAVVLAYASNGDVAAARFSPHASGTVFHPEARSEGTAGTILARFVMGLTTT